MLAVLLALPTWLLVEYAKAPTAQASAGEKITVEYVTATNDDGYYRAGANLDIVVVFSDNVSVKKVPKLSLDLGAGNHLAIYQSVEDNQMHFSYQIQPGENSNDLNYKSKQSLLLSNGAAIEGTGEHSVVDKTLPELNSDNSLAGKKNLVIDTINPVVSVDSKTTDDQTPDLSGTVNDLYMDTVNISVGGKDYPATIDGDKWSIADNTIDALAPGVYDVVATATDLAGNSATDETTNELTVSVIPIVHIEYSNINPTNQDVIATLVEDNEPITVTNNSGSHTYTFTANGDFTFEYVDAMGHTDSATASVQNIDKEVPAAPILGSIISPINADTETISGATEANATIEVSGGEYSDSIVADGDGNFSVILPLTQNAENTFEFVAKDAAGNESPAATAKIVEDSQAPVITIERDPDKGIANGEYHITIDYHDAVTQLYSINSGLQETYTGVITLSDEGNYSIVATGIDEANNFHSAKVEFIIDKTDPTIELNGDEIDHEVGTEYTETAIATDNFDEDVKPVSDIDTAVDFNNLGSYTVTYTATDDAGNTATKTRVINIVDTTKPVITLKGNNKVDVAMGNNYTDEGATIRDNYDTEIELSVNNPVDTTVPGEYVVTYNATDSSGNKAIEVTRKVTVYPNIIDVKVPDFTVLLPKDYGNPVLIKLSAEATSTVLDLSALLNADGQAVLTGDIIIKAVVNDSVMTIVISKDTVISGPAGWDGKLYLPTLTENKADLATADGSYASDVEPIMMGLANQSLTFSLPVKITFENRAEQRVGFVNKDGEFVEITNVCADPDKPLEKEFSKTGECKAIDGEDLVIWTKHFTNFVYYGEEEVIAPKFTAKSDTTDGNLYIIVSFKGIGGGVDEYIVYVGNVPTVIEPVKSDDGHQYEVKVKVASEGLYNVIVRSKKQRVESINADYLQVNVVKPATTTTNSTTTTGQNVSGNSGQAPEVTPNVLGPARASAAAPKTESDPQIDNSNGDDQGIIKGEDTQEDSEDINWTPWIILFILIILAGAATGGYFYWFAGEEEEKEKTKPAPKKAKVSVKQKEKSSKKKYRRW